MKRCVLLIYIALLSVVGLQAQVGSIRVMRYASEPWFMVTPGGEVEGIAAEQARAVIQEAGFTPEFIDLPWTRGLEYLKSGQLDMMVTLSRTHEREAFIYYLGIHAYAQNVIGVHEDHAGLDIQTMDDMAKEGMTWGIRQDMFYSEAFNSRLASDPAFASHFDTQAKQMLNLEKVRFKRLTGLIGDATALRYVLSKSGSEYAMIRVKEVPFLKPDPIYLGLSRKLPDQTIQKLQAAFDRLERRKTMEKILKKWTTAPAK